MTSWNQKRTHSDFQSFGAQRYAITASKQLAMRVVATGIVIDAIAVADVEAVLGAIPPDRALHEPWKRCRKARVELSSVDVRGNQLENSGASSRLIATGSVRVVGTKPPQDPGSVQEIMDQGVDGHEGRAHFAPQRPSVSGGQQQVGHAIANTLSATP